jgi:hypothetical protein
VAVVEEEVSDACLRFEGTLEVLVIVLDATEGDTVDAVDDDDDAWFCWGIVLCCFCGELLAEGGAFFGEFMDGADEGFGGGFVTEGGALEYSVTGAVNIMVPGLLCIEPNIWM